MYQPKSGPPNEPHSDGLVETRPHAEIRAENRQTFARLYEDYSGPLTKRLRSMVSNGETACDLSQEAFSLMWHKYFTSPGPVSQQTIEGFERLLNTIGYNLAIDYLRHFRRLTFVSLPGDEPNEPKEYALATHPRLSVAGHEEQVCDQLLIEAALAAMSEQYRVCVLLQDDGGFTQREIAGRLGISESTVSSNVSRGYKQLRKIYTKLLSERGMTTKGGRERHGKINLRPL